MIIEWLVIFFGLLLWFVWLGGGFLLLAFGLSPEGKSWEALFGVFLMLSCVATFVVFGRWWMGL